MSTPKPIRLHASQWPKSPADQASVLAQVGLIDAEKLPVMGIEASRKVIDDLQEPSNKLIKRTSE